MIDQRNLTAMQKRIIALVGPLSAEDVARIGGRKSSLRALACDLGLLRHLPPLPPIDEDWSLRYDAEVQALRLRRLHGLPLNTNRVGTNGARTSQAKPKPRKKKQDAETPELACPSSRDQVGTRRLR